MPTGRGFLERLRPVGTPGAAARRGVPADRVAEFGAELEPLFELLAEVDAEAARIRLAAEEDARRIVAASRARAEGIVADAMVRAEAARAAAAASGRDEAATEEAFLVRRAGEQATRLRSRAADAMTEHVGRAVAIARAELREMAGLPAESGST
jgi:hypothetical protein